MGIFIDYLSLFKERYKISFIYILLSFITLGSSAQGLEFSSNDSLMSKRTSYTAFVNDIPVFKNHLFLSFDLSLWDNDHLGYIFNIIDNNDSYSLTYIYNHNGYPTLNFNIDSKSNKIEIPLNPAKLKKRNWFHIKADIDLVSNTVSIYVNGNWYKAKGFAFTNTMSPQITFGKNPRYSDVPKMAVKNLEIRDNSTRYFFPLDEWKGNAVHDREGNALGAVDHPSWLINDSYFWTPKFKQSFKEVAGINFNPRTQSLFIFKTDSLIHYNLQNENASTKPYLNKLPVKLVLGKSLVNSTLNQCYVYEALPQDTAHAIASLDLNTLAWTNIGKGSINDQRHHHNIFYDHKELNSYLFGGYGSFSYHNDFFRYDQPADQWVKTAFKGDAILPRFFSASSTADDQDNIYIFGGYGNESGNQIVGGRHFYDLYKVNLTAHSVKKIWEIKPVGEPFVPANNLIVSADKKYFYALCYPHEKPKTKLRLYRFNIKDGSYEIMSGPIPVTSERIESDFNLFYDAGNSEFICTTQEFVSPQQSSVTVYTLASPPVSEHAYLSSQKPVVAGLSKIQLFLLMGGLLAIGGFIFYIVGKRKPNTLESVTDDELTNGLYNSKIDTEIKQNAVYLLGEFTVYDKDGKNITYLFSPKIKQLFILILLNSRNGNGVVSKKISTTLWPDKDVLKTKNIRGVTLNHLRNILTDMEGLELTFTNDTYNFLITDNFFCDYFKASAAIEQVQNHSLSADIFLNEDFELLSRGCLLQDVNEAWLDEVKVVFEEITLNIIQPGIRKVYEAGHYKRAMELSRVALLIDPFNDVAIKYKLKSLRRFKGVDFAKKVYETFTADYKKSLDVDYPVAFDKICK